MSNDQTIFHDTLSDTLDSDWTWLREQPNDWRFQDGGLEICVRPGVKDTVQNALLRPAPDRSEGTYAIEVTITNTADPTQQYEQAGITLYNNGKPIFKEVKERIDGDLYIIPGKKPMPTQSVRLRLIVTATTWEAQYRPQDETDYQTAATGELPAPNNDQISIQCYNGPEEGDHWIHFSDFCITRL